MPVVQIDLEDSHGWFHSRSYEKKANRCQIDLVARDTFKGQLFRVLRIGKHTNDSTVIVGYTYDDDAVD